MSFDNYGCDDQMSIFDYMTEGGARLPPQNKQTDMFKRLNLKTKKE